MKKDERIFKLVFTLMLISLLCVIKVKLTYAGDNDINIKDGSEYECNRPDIIEKNEYVNYSARLRDDEKDLYSFIFKNKDGSKTLRSFEHPVKYLDNKGNIKDISLSIKNNKDGSFGSDQHFVGVSFASDLVDGISLGYKKTQINMKPSKRDKACKALISKDKKRVYYNVDKDTEYSYSLTYLGIKEDIIVKEYTGQTIYEFDIDTNGLHPVRINDSVFLKDDKGVIKACIGDIIVFTADEKNNTVGRLEFKTIVKNNKYRFTIKLDPEFLKDENTAYPITIDPTIEINYNNNGAGAIEDVTINSLKGSVGTSGSLYIGNREDYGVSRVLMKFPGLDMNSIGSADNIVNATVQIRDLLCESESMPIYCYLFNGNDWSESNATWSSVKPDSIGKLLASKTVSYENGTSQTPQHLYSFDITKAVKEWKNKTSSPSKGIIFKTSDSIEKSTKKISKTFASYNRTTYKPSLKVTYKSNINIGVSEISVKEGLTYSLASSVNSLNPNITWSSSNNSVATVSKNGEVTGVKAGSAVITASIKNEDGLISKATCKVYVFIENGVYCIKNKNSSLLLTVRYGEIKSKTDVWQYSKYKTTDNDIIKIRQMWKICYLGSGRYSIRPYSKLDMGLDVTNDNVDIYKIGDNDTLQNIPSYSEWSITYNLDGYIFKNDDDTTLVMQVKDSSKKEKATIIVNDFDNTANCRWCLTKITTAPSGVYWYDNIGARALSSNTTSYRYMIYNSSYTMSDVGLVAIAYSDKDNSQTFNWTSENEKIAIINNNIGIINGVKSGSTMIRAKKTVNGKNVYLYCKIRVIGEEQYKAGVRIAVYEKEQYYDFTIPINRLFREAVQQCKDHRCMNWKQYCSSLSVLSEPSIKEWKAGQLASFLWFYKQVNHKAVWDIKRDYRWKQALPNVPWLKNDDGKFEKFSFRDMKMTAEDLGNIMYGYTGRATGFGKITLFWGGGVANLGSISDERVTQPPYYGDDANDHDNIDKGYDMFCMDYPSYPETGYNGIPLKGWAAKIADLIL